MSRSTREYVQHILDEIQFLQSHTSTITKDDFFQDAVLQRAVVRSIEIIGEAIKHIPEDIRKKYPEIAWKPIAAMRDLLIHAYFGIDYHIVWDVLITRIPVLEQQMRHIIQAEYPQND